jgi:hypothetical protein
MYQTKFSKNYIVIYNRKIISKGMQTSLSHKFELLAQDMAISIKFL